MIRFSKTMTLLTTAAFAAACFALNGQSPAQSPKESGLSEGPPSGAVSGFTFQVADLDPDAVATIEDVKTLDHVRQLKLPSSPEESMSGFAEWYEGPYGAGMGMGGYGTPPGPRQQALNKINDLRRKLKAASEEDRPKITEQLRAALSEYFLVDMQLRVKELDEIKARVEKMEAKLQQRLDTREEAVDLQLKLFLRDAEGLGFFRSADNSVGPYYHANEGAEYPGLEPPAKSFQPESGSSGGPPRNPLPRQKR